MHITLLALSPTVWIIGTLVFFASTLAVSLILYRNAHVGQRTIAALTSDLAMLKATASHATGMYNSLRQQFNEADDAHIKTMAERDKAQGQFKELQRRVAALETTNEAYAEATNEQHEQIAEQKRTITQQQQIIDDLKIECQRILAQRDDGSRLSAQKPAPRKGGKP